ncbi:MAG: sugar phosphate isomerase/epimerase family protein [Planctomycetota bacterium]|jgi:sugar phosphate isomerase/epimerase
MLLGYNTNGLQNHRLDEALRLLADHGYQAVALTLDVQHLDPYRATAKDVAQVGALMEELGLTPVIETGARFLLDPARKHEPTLMSRDPRARDRRLDFYGRAAAIGRDLGARVLSFWAGVDSEPGPGSTAWLAEGVERTCAVVREAGLIPALEPEPGMAVETVAQYQALRNRLGDPLGVAAPALCLDVGHLYVTGEGEPADVIPGVANLLAQVHLEDMRRGVHEHLPPGEGEVDFGEVRQALTAIGYQGAVCFELSRHSHIAPAALKKCQVAWRSGRC